VLASQFLVGLTALDAGFAMAGATRRRFSQIGPGLAQIKLKHDQPIRGNLHQSAAIGVPKLTPIRLRPGQQDSSPGWQASHFAPRTNLVFHVATAHGLSTPVRLIAMTTTLSGLEPVNRCDRSQPGSTSFVHVPPRSVRTAHNHTASPFIGAKWTIASFVAASRSVVIVGRLGAFDPSHGDAGTSAGFA